MKILNLFDKTIMLLLIGVVGWLLYFVYILVPGLRIFTIRTGSMQPGIPVGSVVLVNPSSSLKTPSIAPKFDKNDVITFRLGDSVVTHRIVGIAGAGNEFLYQTKGDANNQADGVWIKETDVIGRVFYQLQNVGKIGFFAKTKIGFFSMIFIPALMLILREIMMIFSDAKKDKYKTSPIGSSVSSSILALGVCIFTLRITMAYFSNQGSTNSNVFSASANFPGPSSSPIASIAPSPSATPSANHIVISEVQINGANANQDFVELYNPLASPVSLAGWQIQKKSSNGTVSSLVLITTGTIPAHGYFLWANNQGNPTPFSTIIGADVSNGNNLSENNSIALEDAADNIVDQVGWGTGTNQYLETTLFPTSPATNQSMERKAYSTSTASTMNGGVDTAKGNGFDSNNNSTDFLLRITSQPQNSTSGTEMP